MTRRRSAGEGTIRERPDGRWEGRVELGWQDGARRRKAVYGRTRAEVVDKLRKVHNQLDHGIAPPDERRTTEDYLRWWLDDVLPGTVKASTAYGYRSVVECNVIPHVGRVQLAKLGPTHVHSMLRALERSGLSPQTRRNARMVLRRALGYAERWGLVARNAAALVDCPRSDEAKLDDALTIDEAHTLLAAARGTRLEALVTLALAVGLRRGEVLGLRWPDVDLDAGTLTISATLKRLPGARKGVEGAGLVLDTPKTEAGRRTLALPRAVAAQLRDHRRRQLEERLAAGSNWIETGHVFATPFGQPLDPDNLTKSYQALTEAAGLGRRRFHALRHSAATLMLAQGVELEVISKTLGHAGYAITADVYARVGIDVQRRAADAMDAVLGT